MTDLAINATITCAATHTVTQADIDAGHYLNTACVNDGAGGAAEECDDADVPANKTPHLSITKTSTDTSYDAVGQIIHYTSWRPTTATRRCGGDRHRPEGHGPRVRAAQRLAARPGRRR